MQFGMASGSRLIFRGHDELRLAGEGWGDPHGDPVLLLPGGGQTRHAWGETAQRLAEQGWYAISLDLRGHGESEWAADGNYTLAAFVADLRCVVAQLGRPTALVGASLGGITGLLAAGEENLEELRALVLVDIAPRMEARGVQRIVEFMRRHLDGFASLTEAAEAVAAYLPHRRPPADLSGLAKNLRRGPDGKYRWHWDPRFVLGDHRPDASQQPERLLAAARRLRVPTLLVRGRMSDVISERSVAEFLDAVPHAQFVDVADAGHMVAGDRNDRFTAAVCEFLSSLRAATPRA